MLFTFDAVTPVLHNLIAIIRIMYEGNQTFSQKCHIEIIRCLNFKFNGDFTHGVGWLN